MPVQVRSTAKLSAGILTPAGSAAAFIEAACESVAGHQLLHRLAAFVGSANTTTATYAVKTDPPGSRPPLESFEELVAEDGCEVAN
jgi:hypothetical protein